MRRRPTLILAGVAGLLAAPAMARSQDHGAGLFEIPPGAWGQFERDNDLWKLTPDQEQALADRAAGVLRGSRNETELKRALWVLARVGVDRSPYVRDLVRVLQGPVRTVHEDALRTIGTLQEQEQEALLSEFKPSPLTDPPALLESLVRAASRAEVGRAWLRPLLDSARDPAKLPARELSDIIGLVVLSGVRDDEARAFLETCLRRADPQSSALAARSLGEYGPAAVPALRSALEDPSPEGQAAAAEALGQIGPAAALAVPRLLDIVGSAPLYDRAAPTRNAEHARFVAPLGAARALRRIGAFDAGVCTALITHIRSGRLEMQSACVWTAGWLGCGDDVALDAMRAMTAESGLNPGIDGVRPQGAPGPAEAERRWIRRRAAWMAVLRREGHEAMRRDMLAYFGENPGQIDPRALDDIEDGQNAEHLVPALVPLLNTRDGRLAEPAARALGRMAKAARPAIPALRRLRWGADWGASLEARRALLLVGAE